MNLPDVATLEEGSDYRAFMSEGVPDKLRRLALRKLWASNPLFGFRDGLNDYDEDFRAISDYVYNTAAMKRFTDPDAAQDTTSEEVSEDAAEDQAAEDQVAEGEEEQGAEETDVNQDALSDRSVAEGSENSSSGEHQDAALDDDEDSLGDDADTELG